MPDVMELTVACEIALCHAMVFLSAGMPGAAATFFTDEPDQSESAGDLHWPVC